MNHNNLNEIREVNSYEPDMNLILQMYGFLSHNRNNHMDHHTEVREVNKGWLGNLGSEAPRLVNSKVLASWN